MMRHTPAKAAKQPCCVASFLGAWTVNEHKRLIHPSLNQRPWPSFEIDSHCTIPHICHLNHLYIGGEKSVMWRNFRFQYMTDVDKSEIPPHVEEFQISVHDRCGEIWSFAKFGGISPCFCCKICFVLFTLFFAKSVLSRFTRFCVEKSLSKNCIGGEKMTNMRYVLHKRRGTSWKGSLLMMPPNILLLLLLLNWASSSPSSFLTPSSSLLLLLPALPPTSPVKCWPRCYPTDCDIQEVGDCKSKELLDTDDPCDCCKVRFIF